jgi:hypothetical protein
MARLAKACAIGAVAFFHFAAGATEGGGTNYIIGFQTANLGSPPAYGLSWLNFEQYYDAESFRNASGGRLFPTFRQNIELTSQRVEYMLPDPVWKNVQLGVGIIVPYISNELKKSANGISFAVDKRKYGLGDIKISPLNVALDFDSDDWGHFDENFRVWISAPTGPYNPKSAFNVGRNSWSWWLTYGQNWRPQPTIQIGFLASYVMNGTNDVTHYQSGNEFVLDYSLGYRFLKNTWIELQGYYYQQVTNDMVNGSIAKIAGDTETGFAGRVLAIGPQIRHNISGYWLGAKWQHETMVEDRPKGDRFWVQFTIPLI